MHTLHFRQKKKNASTQPSLAQPRTSSIQLSTSAAPLSPRVPQAPPHSGLFLATPVGRAQYRSSRPQFGLDLTSGSEFSSGRAADRPICCAPKASKDPCDSRSKGPRGRGGLGGCYRPCKFPRIEQPCRAVAVGRIVVPPWSHVCERDLRGAAGLPGCRAGYPGGKFLFVFPWRAWATSPIPARSLLKPLSLRVEKPRRGWFLC